MRKVILTLVIVCVIAALSPVYIQAAVTPAFTAVNDVILPFNADTMPFISGGEIFVPPRMFAELGIWHFSSPMANLVMIYRGDLGINFWIDQGRVVDRADNQLNWPNARRVGDRFYVPLAQTAAFFGLSWETVEIREDVLPGGNMRLIRLKDGTEIFNGPTLIGFNAALIRTMFNQHFFPHAHDADGDADTDDNDDQVETFSDVTVYLSFYNLSLGNFERILNVLDSEIFPHYRAAFFVTEEDILNNAGLIRRAHGSGHTIGIWLQNGTFEEYALTSALLFEATKVRTILIQLYYFNDDILLYFERNGLILWDSLLCLADEDYYTELTITDALPVIAQERASIRLAAADSVVEMLPGVLAFLEQHEYSVKRITETIAPFRTQSC